MLAVAKHEASLSGLPDLIDPTAHIDRDGTVEVSQSEQYCTVETCDFDAGNAESMADIAEEVVELDRKVGLLTKANAQLEQERDLLSEEKVGALFYSSGFL